MPNTCCVPGCRSGYKGTTEKVSFCLPNNKEQREKWKRAIPRRKSGGFNFESKYTRVCAEHFDDSDIVTAYNFNINGDDVSLEREKPTLNTFALCFVGTVVNPVKRGAEGFYLCIETMTITQKTGEMMKEVSASESGNLQP
ncbi:uncharacterized protein [Dermacentor albipictus]|uniref:uncharacterized protein n=1 Tax=Dermacentor albipictus TaxID=60249 RepID=UPI0038FBF4BF